MSQTIDIKSLYHGIINQDRAKLARAITLIESKNLKHQIHAQQLLSKALPHTGKALRIGITGVPGAGKSTLIENFGLNLIKQGHKVAILAVDPSSSISGGSLLGDKTRMEQLAAENNAFIRPSPSSGTLGGVAQKTRETMLLCEAAGYDILLIETVGIGQSETMVANMTDIFILLMLTGAGDDLQGIKKGIFEIAELIAVNKADNDNKIKATRACADIRGALNMLHSTNPNWQTPVIPISGYHNLGLDILWQKIQSHQAIMHKTNTFQQRRQNQQILWFEQLLDTGLKNLLYHNKTLLSLLSNTKENVANGTITAYAGQQLILSKFQETINYE